MSDIKMKDVTGEKKLGDRWFSVQAPEEIRIWTLKNQWKRNFFSNRGLELSSVTFTGSVPTESEKVRYTKREPLRLPKSGFQISSGTFISRASKGGTYTLVVENENDVNVAMVELSESTGIKNWDTSSLKFWSESAFVTFKRFSPNNSGVSLYFKRVKIDGKERLYTVVDYFEQQRILSKFYEDAAACTLLNMPQKSCAIRYRKELTKLAREEKKKRNQMSE